LSEAAEARFIEAEEQLRRYLLDERLAGVRGPAGWTAYSVVQIGTEAMLCRELDQPTTVLRWDRRRAAPQKKRRGR
jgi:hypothetical protein